MFEPEGEVCLLLDTLEEKITLLEQTGVDDIIVYPFDKVLSQMPASDFVKNIIIGKMDARYLVVGQDHHFGNERNGNVQHLPEYTMHSDVQVEVVDLKMLNRKISSSAIRNALLCGNLKLANEMLGYDYMISGKVIAGNHLGRTIGFPTANIETPAYKLLPKEGVYRVKVQVQSSKFNPVLNLIQDNSGQKSKIGMLYIGKRPVLKQEDAKVHVEVHIFDFDRDIYGQEIAVALTHRIRDDVRFENLEQLTRQLHRDRNDCL